MRPSAPAIAGALVAAAALAATAGAKSPPLGKYDCTIGSGTLFGTIVIKSTTAYTKDGTKGTYTTSKASVHFKDGPTGYTIGFKGGSLDKIKGRWFLTTSPGVYQIALRNPLDGFESIYCETAG